MKCSQQLKEWTGKTRATLVYDSKVDPFTAGELFVKVKNKPNIAIVGVTMEGDVFGMFHAVAVMKQDIGFIDPDVFAFSFESHGRCKTPQRFVLKNSKKTKLQHRVSQQQRLRLCLLL